MTYRPTDEQAHELISKFLEWAAATWGYSLREEREDYGEQGRSITWWEVQVDRELVANFMHSTREGWSAPDAAPVRDFEATRQHFYQRWLKGG